MNLDFSGKTVVVCGSTQGIGFAAALEFAINKANVVLLARNEDKLKLALQQLSNNGQQKHCYLTADFSDPNQLIETIDSYLEKGGDCHILVNNMFTLYCLGVF